MWTLLPLGNPGPEYAATRHNLGRLLLLRWIEARGISVKALREFPSGSLYGLTEGLQALVPATYMNLSGQVVQEAIAAGLPRDCLIAVLDDKDLPLGRGRFRLTGTHGGHNGLRSVLQALGSDAQARLRLGIGPFMRPLHDFVLGAWSDAEWKTVEGLDAPFGAFLELLAGCGALEEMASKVNAEVFWNGAYHLGNGEPEAPAAGGAP